MFIYITGYALSMPDRYPDGWDVVFCYDTSTCTTRGLLRTQDNDSKRFKQSLFSLIALASHPMILGLVSLEISVIRNDTDMGYANEKIKEVQQKTGFTGGLFMNKPLPENAKLEDPNGLSREISEISQITSHYKAISRSTTQLSSFLLEELKHLHQHLQKLRPKSLTEAFERNSASLEQQVRALKSLSEHNELQLERYEAMGKIQIQTVSLYIIAV